jgi:hypothetical protein
MLAVKQWTIDYTFFYGNENANVHLGTGLSVPQGIISLKRVEFINDRIMYI